jgi:hypothetical protein
MKNLKIVYQAYGRTDAIEQVLLSTASLRSWYPAGFPFEIEIYTDQTDRLREFFGSENRVTLVPITGEQIQAWRGKIDFVHRVKLEILSSATKNWDGDLLYLDGDTYFTAHPEALLNQISDSVSVMHVRESTLGRPDNLMTKKVAKFVRGRRFKVGGEEFDIPPSTVMWNAGVMGMSRKNCKLLGNMIELTEVLYGEYRKHTMEQLAVCFYLQRTSEIRAAEPIIKHYWNLKEYFDQEIHRFIEKYPTLPAAVAGLPTLTWPRPETHIPKKGFQKFLELFR